MEEDIKKQWQGTSFRQEIKEDTYFSIIRRHTSLQNLMRRYRWFANISLIMIFAMPLMLMPLIRERQITSIWWFLIVSGIYFATASIMDRWLYNGLKSINLYTDPVAEVAHKALYYRKRHLQFIIVLIPMAIFLIGGMVYINTGDPYTLTGIAVGAVAGLAIGSMQLQRFLADYRDLTHN